jgi:plasmid stabilization system protein ParE
MNYRFEYLDSFWQDYYHAIGYITEALQNRIAARELVDAFEREKRSVTLFPKASRPYASPPEVDADYYALPVKNYLAFYVVRGDVIEFRRFLYSRADLHDRLKT